MNEKEAIVAAAIAHIRHDTTETKTVLINAVYRYLKKTGPHKKE